MGPINKKLACVVGFIRSTADSALLHSRVGKMDSYSLFWLDLAYVSYDMFLKNNYGIKILVALLP